MGMGNDSLNDKYYGFIASRTIENDNAIGTFELKCGLGSLELGIKKLLVSIQILENHVVDSSVSVYITILRCLVTVKALNY